MDKFDAVVVGAGPAGCAAAYTLAKAGLQVLVCERGKYAGAKNMWGGAFFGPQMYEIFPDFAKEAPVERFVNRHTITLLDPEDALTFDFRTPHSPGSPHGFITLRAKFDRWMAEKVEQAGAIVATSLQADDLVREGSFIKGVKAGAEEFPADVVILAEGVNSLLTEKAGLRQPDSAHDMKQGVKEVIRLPQEILEERFQLQGQEGVAMEFLGSCTRGLPGGGFLYTNRDSISLGMVVQLSAVLEKRVKISDLLEDFKKHPVIQPLIRKGELVEYSAHLIPVSGLKMMPRLFSDGVLVVGDAAALVLGTGLILEGANFSVASGVAAAKAVIQAKEKGDFSRASLQQYERLLQDGGTLRDFQTFRRAPEFLENERIYAVYPQWACGLARKIFTNDGKPRQNTFQVLRESMKGRVTLGNLISDALKARKAI
ncbi:MAG: FAD-dependent oxidoreductase [Deltaproteobacteria bacterium]|nr:FAD-dependent oxidoreductase [Deltaproteobacteria bacterium]